MVELFKRIFYNRKKKLLELLEYINNKRIDGINKQNELTEFQKGELETYGEIAPRIYNIILKR